MERTVAVGHLKNRLFNKNLIKHSYAVEAIMRKLAEYFGEDVEKWGLAGLLHDIDYETTANDMSRHGMVGGDILEGIGVDESIVYSVRAHNDLNGIERKRKMDKSLFCSDPTSGLITAGALILPTKKLSDVTLEFLLNRMDEKTFAKGANREYIKTCSEIGLSLEEYLKLSLEAMQSIADELEL